MDKSNHDRELTGRLDPASVHRGLPRIPREVVERYRRLDDAAGTVSDVLDHFGIRGCVGSSELRATIADARIVGTAVTVRNTPDKRDPYANVSADKWGMAEIEGINQAEPGDVLVIQGVRNVSNMGGVMASVAKRQGLAGAVVEGGVRDLGHSRSIGYPVWSSDVTPSTGKWRVVTEEINGPVTIRGVKVAAGDLVVADETGVCFVPHELVEAVIDRCEEIAEKETSYIKDIDEGLSVPELTSRFYGSSR